MSSNITLLMPVLNEIDGLKHFLPKIPKELFYEILVVDGGSNDGTVDYCKSFGARTFIQKKKGVAFAIIEGLEATKTDYVITFSPDGNCELEQLPILVEKLKQNIDLVVVSRYLPPAKSEDDDFFTSIGNYLFTLIIRLLGKAKITDSLNIYRGFRKNIALSEDFLKFLYGPVFEPLLSSYTTIKNYSYAEIPGNEPKRIAGERKMKILYNGSCIVLLIIRMYLLKIGIKI